MIVERILHWVHHAPERIAHVVSGRQTTYGELGAMADAVAAHLRQRLHGDGSPVAVFGHKEPEVVAAFLGCLKAGHPYVPIDRASPPARATAIAAAAGAAVTLTPDVVAGLPRVPAQPYPAPPGRPLYILFTSGSTGVPKGVVLTEPTLTGFLDWNAGAFGLPESGGTFLNQASFGFDLSVPDLYLSLTRGGTLVCLTAEETSALALLPSALEASGAEYCFITPSFGALCLADKRFGRALLPRMKNVLFCGETLPGRTALGFIEQLPGAAVWNSYGPTEACVFVTAVRLDPMVIERYPQLPIGTAMPFLRVAVRDEERREVPESEEGELVIGGASVSPGYYQRPDLTAGVFGDVDGAWSYRTGDLGHREGSMFFFHGRRDQQIKFHGYRIELGDIESHLRLLPDVGEAAVVPRYREGRPDSLRAFIVLKDPAGPRDFSVATRIRQSLGASVPPQMVPQHVHFLAAMPMSAHGKVDRKRLAELPMQLVVEP